MGIAYVIGGANCVFDDMLAAIEIVAPDYIVAVNDVVAYYPGNIDVMATLHPRYLTHKRWIASREMRGYPPIPRVVAQAQTGPYVTDVLPDRWPEQNNTGSSGLFAIKAAFELLGATKVILCGVPLSQTNAHFFDTAQWGDASIFQPQWEAVKPRLIDKVKSMSGFTSQLLGKPTVEWANDYNH